MNRFLSCTALIVLFLSSSIFAQPATQPTGERQRLSLDRGWLFHLGDIPFPVIKGHQQSYNNAKAGQAWGAAAPDFDDSDWPTVNLPHDWAVEGPFDQDANLSQGYRPRGFGWYRRYFKIDRTERGKNIELQFDGIATHCTIWVNGVLAHRNFCGYTSSYIDITPFAKFGEDVNIISVRVDAEAQEGWWYEGAGIYRHTWLVKQSPIHVATDGVFANPVRNADGTWTLPVEVTLNNTGKESPDVEVEAALIDAAGQEVAKLSTTAMVKPFDAPIAKLAITINSPQLWSIDDPKLYSVKTTIRQAGNAIDQTTTQCGFRTIRFDADKGFFLNDQPVKIQGTCNHQDHAGVGVAVPDSLWEFRLRRLKEMGSNAYRCAHNPPAKEFLDECDRIGMLVLDENRNFNTTPEYMRQLEWLTRRDRNHPSVVLWSVFNEEPFQGTEQGYEMVRRMSAFVKTLDTTRPVTAAQSNSMLNPVNASQAADVAGFNYRHGEYDRYHAANPTKPMTSSEDTSAVMTRGEYRTDRKAGVIDSYDTQFQSWGATHRNGWKAIAERPFMAGGFVWTGFDYRGEPQPLEWPTTGSSFGIMDLCGFPKSAFYIHQAQWRKDPILQLVPHWNWEGQEGKPIKVLAITNADTVTLLLNGKEIGTKPVDKYQGATWDVPYQPGKLEAIGRKGDEVVSKFAVETAGSPAAIRLTADRAALAGDGWDAMPITVEAIDADGRTVPLAKNMVRFELTGPANIIGLNNGNPICHEPEKGNQHSLFNGLAQVIVQSAYKSNGKVTLRASSEGLTAGEVTIDITTVEPRPEIPASKPTLVVGRWRSSPVAAVRPDPNQQISKTDMNTWGNAAPGRLQPFTNGQFVIYRAQFRAKANVKRAGGTLILRDIVGKAQVYLDGKLVTEKNSPDRETVNVKLDPGDGDHTVNVLIEAAAGSQAGLGGAVTVE